MSSGQISLVICDLSTLTAQQYLDMTFGTWPCMTQVSHKRHGETKPGTEIKIHDTKRPTITKVEWTELQSIALPDPSHAEKKTPTKHAVDDQASCHQLTNHCFLPLPLAL